MLIYNNEKWHSGFLDYHRAPDEYRIQVLLWRNVVKLEGMFFIRPRSLRLVWNYLREIGFKEVLRKISSRRGERRRNEKYLSIGVGMVMESPDTARFGEGQLVVFIAPSHPPCVERVVLPEGLIAGLEDVKDLPVSEASLLYSAGRDRAQTETWWHSLRGWSRFSGVPLSDEELEAELQEAQRLLHRTDWQKAERMPLGEHTAPVAETSGFPSHRNAKRRPVGHLFGYGNYAKTLVLPNVAPYIDVSVIHEIDPTQIPLNSGRHVQWDTSPEPRDAEPCDVSFIAGYHHTHASLAVNALERGAAAVVEKPLVVDRDQLTRLSDAMRRSGGRVFTCFHKRYLPFNEMAREDLGVGQGEPISYHCIVYEVPLPELHWYRWPNSHSRLISNGCHWTDHFLYLNNFASVQSYDLTVAPDGTLNCSVTLNNGAFFTMVLTDTGSERIGVQDYVELRANGVTVKMVNGAEYRAESKDRVVRQKRINKMHTFRRMYTEISRKVVGGESGDSLQSVESSGALVLALEEKLKELLQAR